MSHQRDGFVYFIASGQKVKGKTYIKIGWACDVQRRLRGLQVGNPEPLVLLHEIPGDRALERELHRRFWRYRIDEKSEWFEAGPVTAYLGELGAFSDTVRSTVAA